MQSGVSSQWSLMHPSYYFQQHSSVRFFVSVKFDKNEKHFVFLDESKLFSPSFFLFSSLFFPTLHYGQPCCTVCGGCKPLSPTPPCYHSTFTCVPFKIVVLICKPNESEDCWTGRMLKRLLSHVVGYRDSLSHCQPQYHGKPLHWQLLATFVGIIDSH